MQQVVVRAVAAYQRIVCFDHCPGCIVSLPLTTYPESLSLSGLRPGPQLPLFLPGDPGLLLGGLASGETKSCIYCVAFRGVCCEK